MAKIILGKPPKSFTKELSFPMLDGTVGTMKITYKYRSRKEFAAFVDGMLDVLKAEGEAEIAAAKAAIAEGVEPVPNLGASESTANEKNATRQADYIMDVVEGWNLDVPFDREAVEQLVDELPLAATTIIQSYRTAMTEGRLGN
jgi:hypothetical protein